MTKQPLAILFSDNSNDSLPVYCQYDNQYMPQDAFITLDLECGEIDADYSGEIGNGGVPASVWNDVMIRFPINAALTGESISTIIEDHKDKLQALYDVSEVEFNFNCNLCGGPVDGMIKETWFYTINQLRDSILSDSQDLVVNIGGYDELHETINSTPLCLNNLSDHAALILEVMQEFYFLEPALNDADLIKKTIIEYLAENPERLNKNGMEMLLANIDDYSDQTGYDLSDICQDHIDAAMLRV